MPARIRQVTVDCIDPFLLSRFWAGVTGFVDDPDDPNESGDGEVLLIDPRGLHPGLLFIAVPEAKAGKNRVHVDLQPDDERDVAVAQIEALGGAVLEDRRHPDGSGWVVMADPEGNELCVERSATERGAPIAVVEPHRPMPPIELADERTMLTQMLDWYRAGVVLKVTGVSALHAAVVPFGSASSIAGILKHLALVEDHWFTHEVAGSPIPAPWADVDWEADRDWEFHTAVNEPLDDLIELYEVACARSRAVIAAGSLDDRGGKPERIVSLRYVLLHMIEETARHLGHLDLLREHLDGTTGE